MTANDGPLIGILMHLTYKEEMHLANIFQRDFAKKKKKKKKLNGDHHRSLYGVRHCDHPLSDNCWNLK